MTIGRRWTWAAALAAATAVPVGAQAGNFDIRAADNAVWVAGGTQDMVYAETLNGKTLDRERGWMQSWEGGVGILTVDDGHAPLRNLYARLDGSYTTGSTAYTGQYQDGTPATTTTNSSVWTARGRLGRAFWARPVMLIPYAELGYRNWDRNITGNGGYDETYHNWDSAAGLLAQYSPFAKVVLSVDGAIGYSVMGRMHTGGTQFDLGGEPTWHVGAQAGYTFTKRFEAIAKVSYSQMAYGLSPGVPTPGGTSLEPNSSTHETALRVGLAYHFF